MSLYQILVQVELCSLPALFLAFYTHLRALHALHTLLHAFYHSHTRPSLSRLCSTASQRSQLVPHTLYTTIRSAISSLSVPHVSRHVTLLFYTALSVTGSGELWFLGWKREGMVHEAGTMGYCFSTGHQHPHSCHLRVLLAPRSLPVHLPLLC